MVEAELDQLRLAYLEVSTSSPSATRRLFATYLADREAQTISALRRYREFDSEETALDVHVRLGWAFPIIGLPTLDSEASLVKLFDTAEHSDKLLGTLRDRVELYAGGAQLRSLLAAIECIVDRRRRHLATAQHELGLYARVAAPPTAARVPASSSPPVTTPPALPRTRFDIHVASEHV